MPNLHCHYDQLSDAERKFADEAMRRVYALRREWAEDQAHDAVPLLRGDDPSEEAVDGIAKWIIASR